MSFPVEAVDSNAAQTLTFTATGLPPGMTIASNGTISGSGSTLGTYTVTVTAKDTAGVSGTATFVWSVVLRLVRRPVSRPHPPDRARCLVALTFP